MRLDEQRDRMRRAIEEAAAATRAVQGRVTRKMAATYADGSRSDMVNASSDVLPGLVAILDVLADAMMDTDESWTGWRGVPHDCE